MNHCKTIVIYADVMERFNFFSKIAYALKNMNYNIVILTTRLSIYKISKKNDFKTLLLKNVKALTDNCEVPETNKSLSVLNRYHSAKDALAISNAVCSQLDRISKEYDIIMFFIWNGTTTIARAISSFADKNKIQKRFFEISNLGDRIFVDIKGTNANSYIFKHPEILDKIDIEEDNYKQWLVKYNQLRKLPKQSKNRSRIPILTFLDILGYLFFNAIREDKRCYSVLVIERFLNKFHKHNFQKITLDRSYAFLPLQVSDDSQIQLFSDYSNESVVLKALDICKKKDVELVVKIHPAESSRKAIQRIVKMSKKYSFSIAGNDTEDLVKNAKFIIVNNTTVGLEAMIQGKEVLVFGRAIYANFDLDRIKKYILRYLLPADYFGNNEIDIQSVNEILNRDKWK